MFWGLAGRVGWGIGQCSSRVAVACLMVDVTILFLSQMVRLGNGGRGGVVREGYCGNFGS